MTRTISLTALLAAAAAMPAAAQTMTEVWRTGGFAMPESAYFEGGSGQIVVSNIGVFGPDGGMDGRLSLVDTDGAIIAADWITGLMDPKGMASHDGRLYVADAVGLQVIDIAAGTLVETIALPDAVFPNDVTAGPDGTIYVTEFLAGGIWALKDGQVSWLVAPGGVPLPNGILWQGDRLLIGSFGDVMNPDFTVQNPGGLWSVDPASGAVTVVAGTEGAGSIDGIAEVGGRVIFDDNPSGRILALADGVMTEIGTTAAGAADLGASPDLLLIPFLNSGEVVAYRVE